MIHFGMPIVWTGLAIAAIIIYFSQISGKLPLPQAIVGLVFFLVTILDIDFNKITWQSINAHLDAKRITKKLGLVVLLLSCVATVSFLEGWSATAGNAFLRPIHHHFHEEYPKPWTFVTIHSIVSLLGF
jgi:hypothetical protein